MEVFILKKDHTISLRVRREQLEKIKDLGFKYSDVWEFGYERICEMERSELEKIVQKYHNLYIHAYTKLKNFGKRLESEHRELDRLLKWYTKQHRSIDNPSNQDIDTLKFQMKKRDIHSFTVGQVLEYFQENKPREQNENKF